ncbi:hypothetical protein PAXRUDRAFT_169069 [Paxillus rubicundulus Ve08.2h10]|uniref:Unplaced genomic scaffold scaffold_2517, whole genome shotgun sequence n=1 Tax=Paxillus rubicundulus Ve08.2h10 TaxID=930991 RepID=A0A0D0DFV7_9AGAM|nr:hypothetical protein PAXRUDRAFT_169069 [Paxillus rubicundulus Ve08.2h10]
MNWIAASLQAAHSFQASSYTAKNLRKWAQSFISDRTDLPINLYGSWNVSLLNKGELAKEIHMHLQTIGKYVSAADIIQFLDTPDVKERYALKKTISLTTAQRWMHMMDYRWTKAPSGQYIDGHECEDVVKYRQTTFLPTIGKLEWNLREWKDGLEEMDDKAPRPQNRQVVIWYHNESTFYANDRRKVYWVHTSETAKPRQKGEGASIMVVDFVSADYGWLRSPDSSEWTRVLFRAGKAQDGYYTNNDILAHARKAMDILEKYYPDERHVLVFDNATTHIKQADDALSARKMSKFPTKPGNPFFGVERNVANANGKPVYAPNGKILKEKVRMRDTTKVDGTVQSLYFRVDEENPGVFKGMAKILEERGYTIGNLRTECVGFKCPPNVPRCCCRRLLYNEPDFAQVPSLLESVCHARRFKVIFLPKFHCELNFIEQCWGYAKRKYCEYPPSVSEAVLEQNVIRALESVPICTIRRYATRSLRFMDAYRHGLDGRQAIWAAKKYRGHRVLPQTILDEVSKAGK